MTGGVSNFSARWMDTSSGDASPKQMLMQVAVMRKSRAIKSRIYHGTFSNACSPQRQRQKPSWSVLPIILGRDLGLNSVCPKQSPPISCPLARILSLIGSRGSLEAFRNFHQPVGTWKSTIHRERDRIRVRQAGLSIGSIPRKPSVITASSRLA
jgi:hypothetical protein